MKTLRQILTDECIKEGFDTDDESLEEYLREEYKVVHRQHKSSHRWRDDWWVVVDVGGRFFMYIDYTNNNENDAEGCGYYFEGIDKVKEVFPYEKTVTFYK